MAADRDKYCHFHRLYDLSTHSILLRFQNRNQILLLITLLTKENAFLSSHWQLSRARASLCGRTRKIPWNLFKQAKR